MNIEFTNNGGDGKRETLPLVDYVQYRLQSNEFGAIESVAGDVKSARAAVARLVNLMFCKGLLTLEDVGVVVGAPWEKDELSESVGEQTFFPMV